MEQSLATNADAQLILKLYELRTEETMRQARAWMTGKFWPTTAEEFFAVAGRPGTQENAYMRQVSSYWEMAASFVLYGALSGELFIASNNENFFLFAKFQPFLAEVRQKMPPFLEKTEQLVQTYPAARQRVEQLVRGMDARRAAATAKA